ncbi:TIGR03085 family metal-binding protein [Micrococcus endophyticus]|uniref:TIGR03085 family metal-binding protein n=1 Tax=Micrococcus endophyticus TaxID=455343 RepID=UPI0035A98FE0
MTTFAAAERARLADLLLEKGPHAPTLCDGWSTRDLAAHLWLRESRPDAFAALFIPPLSRHLDRLTAETTRRDYAEVVREWAAGPSVLNPMRAADKHVNVAEHFIHLEDVRRGEAEAGGALPAPRSFTEDEEAALYRALRRMAPLFLRKSTAPVVLQAPGRAPVTVAREAVALGTPVTVTGEVGELLLWASGRDAVHVELDGDASAAVRGGI